MIEAVGDNYWHEYFAHHRPAARPGGRVGLQAITMPHDRMLATHEHLHLDPQVHLPRRHPPVAGRSIEVTEQHTALRVGDRLRSASTTPRRCGCGEQLRSTGRGGRRARLRRGSAGCGASTWPTRGRASAPATSTSSRSSSTEGQRPMTLPLAGWSIRGHLRGPLRRQRPARQRGVDPRDCRAHDRHRRHRCSGRQGQRRRHDVGPRLHRRGPGVCSRRQRVGLASGVSPSGSSRSGRSAGLAHLAQEPRQDGIPYARMSAGRTHVAVLLRVYGLQGVLIWFVSLPLQVSAASGGGASWVIVVGVLLWLVGVVSNDPETRSWRPSRLTRPPRARSWTTGSGPGPGTRTTSATPRSGGACSSSRPARGPDLLTILSPFVMTFFLVQGSGGRLTEKEMAKRPGYAEYMARTSFSSLVHRNGSDRVRPAGRRLSSVGRGVSQAGTDSSKGRGGGGPGPLPRVVVTGLKDHQVVAVDRVRSSDVPR